MAPEGRSSVAPPGTSRLLAVGLAGSVLLAWLRTDPAPPDPVATPLIEVRGEVPRPGLHLVPAPTVDAALAAAGAAPIGDLRPLVAGDRVVLGASGAEILAPSDPVLVGRPVDPNTADAEALAAVPGLSERLAAAIVADRADRGPYRGVGDLRRVRGIGPHKLDAIAPHLELGEVPAVDLNRATAPELEALPGIGPALAERIVADRAENGPYPDLAALERVAGVGPATVARLEGAAVVGARR